MFSFLTKQEPAKDDSKSVGLSRTLTVKSGIKAEQERSDILQEQIVILSEKAAQAYDKVAEYESENQRLQEKIKNLEGLLVEKSTINKRKTTNQELLDLKIQNNNLNDTIYQQDNEINKLKREASTLKTINEELHDKNTSLTKNNELLVSEIRSTKVECSNQKIMIENLTNKIKENDNSLNSLHEREQSLSSLSSKGSTMFSYTRNSSTEDVNKETLASPLESEFINNDGKKYVHYNVLVEKLHHEKQKRDVLLMNFKAYQSKAVLLNDFNSQYINQLREKLEQHNKNEAFLRKKLELMQANMSIISSSKYS